MIEPSGLAHMGMQSTSGCEERMTAQAWTPALRIRPSRPSAVSKIWRTSPSFSMRLRTSAASLYRSCEESMMPASGMSVAATGGGRALVMRSAMEKPGWPWWTRAASLSAALVLIVPKVMTWATNSEPYFSVA